jgi:hypothetical protein
LTDYTGLVYRERERARRLYGDRLVTTGLELMYGTVTADDFVDLTEEIRTDRHTTGFKLRDFERKYPRLKDAKGMLTVEGYAELLEAAAAR